MQKHSLTTLTSRQCNACQVQGGDIMLVPVGSVEVLGPHLPLGGRSFIAEAFCALLAEQIQGLTLPMTPYSSVQATFDRPGSIDVPETILNDFMRAVLDDLLATGFRRLLLVTYLDYLRYYIPQEFYEDHQVAAAGIHPGEILHRYQREQGIREDSCIVGALRILERDALADRIERENERLLREDFAQSALPDALMALQRVGSVGFAVPPGTYPLAPDPNLSGEKGAQALRAAVTSLVPAVESLRSYNEFLAKRSVSRGMMWRGWRDMGGDPA